MSDTMQYGVLHRWLKKVGDHVLEGDILAEVETDKATMELESYHEGVLLYIGVKEKEKVYIDAIIAIIGHAGENIDALIQAQCANKVSKVLTVDNIPLSCDKTPALAALQEPFGGVNRILASPLAKKIAKEKQYDITKIKGSGYAGRIVKKDVLNFDPCFGQQTQAPQADYQDESLSIMRQTIAKVLTESKSTVPHFYLTVRVNMGNLVVLREKLNAYADTRISINDFLVKAVALALVEHPKMNVAWMADTIRYYKQVNIGIAVAIPDGLIVPVVRLANQKSLIQISKDIKGLTQKAQQRSLSAQACRGATFTISNLGMFGIENFMAILNPPEACILAVGAIRQEPIVQDNAIVPAHMMSLTLSCDHRVVDGAMGALFLETLKAILENPLKMVI